MKACYDIQSNPGRLLSDNERNTVLLVDNDDTTLKFMSEVLRMNGYDVAVFYDAPSALHFANRKVRKFDLVITDYRLPGMNGLELIEALKGLQPDMPMVLLTDHRDIDVYSNSVHPGIFEYITKPWNILELLRIVREALGTDMPEPVPDVGANLMEHVERYQNILD